MQNLSSVKIIFKGLRLLPMRYTYYYRELMKSFIVALMKSGLLFPSPCMCMSYLFLSFRLDCLASFIVGFPYWPLHPLF